MTDLFDVIEVEIRAPHRIRLIAEEKTEKNAEAIWDAAESGGSE